MHETVLLQETIAALQPRPGGDYVDGTVGAGGHALALLEASAPDGRLIGLDQDETALGLARERLKQFGDRVLLFHSNFDQLAALAQTYNLPLADGIVLDLGVSSMQLDQAERGFPFQTDAPLDMRMNRAVGESAASLVNSLAQDDLANIIYRYGEERLSRRIARSIVAARPITRTKELADLIARVVPAGKKRQKIHPATRTFQALRIAVNDELGALERVLPQALTLLKPGGRFAVISFHSLEDRIVKHFFKQEATNCICPPDQLVCTCNHEATVKIVTRKPITATNNEIERNPRARSAKLRVVELIKV
ncbi:MAG: 16S rRNA (cytosine(1402)-N(4))-methyltransferase RsmH [Anaerolineae bacterium]|nr:16S rRNA (cytosine(1402)-N(4))-methyltransferase RsmH [Anaerolineae bacterium]